MKINEIMVRPTPLVFENITITLDQVEGYFREHLRLHTDSITGLYMPHKFKTGYKLIKESKTTIDNFLQSLGQMDYAKTVKIGDMFSVLSFDISYVFNEVEVNGFTTPKKVAAIKLTSSGKINYIMFDDGDRFPRHAPAQLNGKAVIYSVYFNSKSQAEKGLTFASLNIPADWTLNIDESLTQSIAENTKETYQPPELETGDDIRVGKFKNVKAKITGFGKDKNNQPTVKTSKGTQQLFKPRIVKLMPEKVNEGTLTEIDFANEANDLPLSDEEIIFWAKEIGNIDDEVVFTFNLHTEQMYFFAGKNKISAYIVIDNNNQLRGMKNVSGKGGQITALLLFVARQQIRGKIKIAADEKLTDDGFRWLAMAINNSPLIITDANGNNPDLPMLKKEWTNAVSQDYGPTELFIESTVKLREPIKRGLLMPLHKWVGRKDLL